MVDMLELGIVIVDFGPAMRHVEYIHLVASAKARCPGENGTAHRTKNPQVRRGLCNSSLGIVNCLRNAWTWLQVRKPAVEVKVHVRSFYVLS